MGRLVPPLLLLLSFLCLLHTDRVALSAERQDEYLELRRIIGREQFREAIERCKALIEKYPDYLYLYETMAEVCQYGGDLDNAEVYFDRRIENGTELGLAYFGLGNVEYAKGDFKTAFLAYDKAVEFGVKAPECYKGLEYSFEKIEGIEAAIRYFTTLCHRNPENANFWYALALAHWGQKEYQVVLRYIREALSHDPLELKYREAQSAVLVFAGSKTEGRQKIRSLMKEAQAVADLSGLEMLLTYLTVSYLPDPIPRGRDSEIQLFLEQAKDLGLFRWLGWGYARMADIACQRGDFNEALKLSRDAYSSSFKVLDHELTMVALRTETEALYDLGDFQNALASSFKRLRLAFEPRDQLEISRALSDIALNLHELGENQEALRYAVEAITRSQLYPNDHTLLFQIHNTLGLVYSGLGQWNAALGEFRIGHGEALNAGRWKYIMALSYGNVGCALLHLKELTRAKREFVSQLETGQRLHYVREVGQAFANLGEVSLELGNLDSAEFFFVHGIKVATEFSQKSILGVCATGLGRVRELRGKAKDAIVWYSRALDIERINNRILLTSTLQEPRAQYSRYALENCVRLHCERGEFWEALKINEQWLRAADALLGFSRVVRSNTLRDSLEVVLTKLNQQLLESNGSSAYRQSSILAGELQDADLLSCVRIADIERELSELVQKGAQAPNNPDSSELSASQLRLLQSRLSKDEAVVEYCVEWNQTDAFLVKHDTLIHFTIPYSAKYLASMLARASSLFDPKVGGDKIWNRVLAYFNPIAASDLYEALISPIETDLGEVRRIRFVRDEPLSSLPFEALILPKNRRTSTFPLSANTFFVERYEVSYAFSFQGSSQLSESVDCGPQKAILGVAADAGGATSRLNSGDRLILAPESSLLRPLPGVTEEIARIAELFGNQADVLVGTDATPSRFKEIASRYNIIHLAGHAICDEIRPMYSRIIFSPGIEPNWQGSLKAFELLGMDIKGQLVVLSACNSGRSDPGRCINGLVTGFLSAGARTVIASQWNADDVSSCDLLVRFYQHLRAGDRASRALQQAKMDFIRSGQGDPFCWAGFVLFGETLPVDVMRNPPRMTAWVWGIISMLVLLLMIQTEEAVGRWRKKEIQRRYDQ